jgi:hypothetical protein
MRKSAAARIFQNRTLALAFLLSLNALSFAPPTLAETHLNLSEKESAEVGHKIWRNECGGTVAGLTSWNAGEEFPSLGIGHFIWYPQGTKGPFDESFPKMLGYIKDHGAKVPEWLTPSMPCPWLSRAEFLKDQNGERMKQLRDMLSSTVGLQTDFIVQRLEDALPKILEKAPEGDRERIKKQFNRVLGAGSAGAFALIDYVNFKGEGILDSEKYNGEGWGMLQVLQGMSEKTPVVQSFSDSAKEVLARRVRNSPPARNEQKWLPGWTRRVNDYKKA